MFNRSLTDINNRLDELRKQRHKINDEIIRLEAEKNLKLSDEYKNKYILDKDKNWNLRVTY
ncbi:hypothetical protein SAMN04487895_101527 [Paenibacillus sophorae]|uniref:Uncharacterized protein n=1 Tax=Paenibacillus sophorae TaxID=1333845 RepID=A0A1H8GJU2_9BACL|nr:hypothetical protein [Paenibacillus sophorae]QWU14237.1 hypothetical protein KP014_20210 [Paenibacillus sophorae]SEN43747.1 hypothetical protein SAMN04487895_101527 [Paenibacillus sophorae]